MEEEEKETDRVRRQEREISLIPIMASIMAGEANKAENGNAADAPSHNVGNNLSLNTWRKKSGITCR